VVNEHDRCKEWLLLLALFLIASCYIIGSSYVGLNGHHVWRQADVFVQIQGFYDGKYSDPLRGYFDNVMFYDVPIYQYIIALVANVFDVDPLVATHYINFICWIILLVSGYFYSEILHAGAGIVFAFILTTSPLLLHYHSVPLPDVFALCLSMLSLYMLARNDRLLLSLLGSFLLLVAALIKSPIPFVFVVFYVLHSALSSGKQDIGKLARSVSLPMLFSLIGVVVSVKIRSAVLGVQLNAAVLDPLFFGTLQQRLSFGFLEKMYIRFFDSFSFHIFAYGLFVALLCYVIAKPNHSLRLILPYVLSFLSGWLVFSNVYYFHDYYELPVMVIVFLGFSEVIARLLAFECCRKRIQCFKDHFSYFTRIAIYLCLLSAVIVFMPKISNFNSASLYDSLRFALRSTDKLIFVTDDSRVNPAIGGLLNTKFTQIKKLEFEENCTEYISNNKAVLVTGKSLCLETLKPTASTYIEEGGLQFYLPEAPRLQAEPVADISVNTDATSVLYSSYTTDDPSVFDRHVTLTENGILVRLADLDHGLAVFDVAGKLKQAELGLLRMSPGNDRRRDAFPTVSVRIKLDAKNDKELALLPGTPVVHSIDLSSVTQLKLQFTGAARTPYDYVYLFLK